MSRVHTRAAKRPIRTLRRTPLAVALLATTALTLSFGQEVLAQNQPLPPEHYTLDANGVDLVTGILAIVTIEVSIGDPNAGALSHGRVNTGGMWRDLSLGSIKVTSGAVTVALGAESDVFSIYGSTFIPRSNEGQKLETVTGGYKYTTRTGAVAWFTTQHAGAISNYDSSALLTRVDNPNGTQTRYVYSSSSICSSYDPYSSECTNYDQVVRLEQVENTYGFRLSYYYKGTDPEWDTGNFLVVDSVMATNGAIDYCTPYCYDGGPSRNWPKIQYNDALGQVATDQSGRATTYVWGATGIEGVRYPGQSANDFSLTRTALGGKVTSFTGPNGIWTYSYTDSGSTRTTVATGPLGQQLTVVSDLTIGRATSVTNALGQTTNYLYDTQTRLTRITNPEGDYIEYAYDSRGNVTQTTQAAKPGSGLAAIVTTASYASTCANVVTCNRPISLTDARGGVTDLAWDPSHGGLLSVTAPAPSPGAVRPQSRVTYASRQASYKQGWPIALAPGPAISVPVEVSACATTSSCDGTSDEVVTSLQYGGSAVPNNLGVTSVSQGSGINPSVAVTAITYTVDGDIETVDGPLAGASDTTRFRYDTARQVVGVVGPDPDGGGALLNRAQRLTYSPRGQVTMVETGTTPGYTDTNWASFDPLLRSATVYDTLGRPLVTSQQSGAGTTVGVQQISYDAAGRPDCTAVRMNPAAWGSLPTSACTATTAGGDGPDRITRTTYDGAGRPLSTTDAYGLTGVAATTSVTYGVNGQVISLTDGNGNVSTQDYDGFTRPTVLHYPNPATADYEQVTYDAYGRMVSSRDRAGRTTTLALDNLGRVTTVDAPAGTMDVAYTYDNLGRVLTTAGGGQTLTNVWDPLSRLTSETGPLGAMSYWYDERGAMTRIIWPDAFYARYDRDVSGAVTAIRENGATSGAGVLATYAYNNLGQPTGITRGDATTTAYGYDAAGRMTSLSHNMAGSGSDVTFGYSWNPAGQIASRTVSNAAYVYAPNTGSTSYTNNSLNQVTAVGGTSVTYDANQNTASALGNSYGYDAANRLTSATIGGTAYAFTYDPGGRLYSSAGGHFQYSGVQLVGEYNGVGVLQTRHVPGPGLDQPVATYFGAVRFQQIADERGSIVGVANAGGSVDINRYDEYGVPSAGNRFQYTGQAWMAPGLYHYRARAYAPQLGRFLQPDPIGYQAGMNVYGYVNGDPLNLTDPLGLQEAELDEVVVPWLGGFTRAGSVGGSGRADGGCTRFGGNELTSYDTSLNGAAPMCGGAGSRRPDGSRPALSSAQHHESHDTAAYARDIALCNTLANRFSRLRCFESASRRAVARESRTYEEPLVMEGRRRWRIPFSIPGPVIFLPPNFHCQFVRAPNEYPPECLRA